VLRPRPSRADRRFADLIPCQTPLADVEASVVLPVVGQKLHVERILQDDFAKCRWGRCVERWTTVCGSSEPPLPKRL